MTQDSVDLMIVLIVAWAMIVSGSVGMKTTMKNL